MEPKSRSTFEGNSTFSSSNVIVQMESLENKQFHFFDVTCSLMGKISATTKLTKLLPIRRLLAGKQFIVTCHVINDSASLWRKISLPNRRLLREKNFIIRCHMTPKCQIRTCAVKGEITAIKVFTCCLAWGSGGWHPLLAISSCCSYHGCRSGGFLSLVIFFALDQQTNKSTNTTTT